MRAAVKKRNCLPVYNYFLYSFRQLSSVRFLQSLPAMNGLSGYAPKAPLTTTVTTKKIRL